MPHGAGFLKSVESLGAAGPKKLPLKRGAEHCTSSSPDMRNGGQASCCLLVRVTSLPCGRCGLMAGSFHQNPLFQVADWAMSAHERLQDIRSFTSPSRQIK